MAYILVKLNQDPDLEDPSTFGQAWQVASFQHNHKSWENHDLWLDYDKRPANIGVRRKLTTGTAFRLCYSEHGNCSWNLDEDGTGGVLHYPGPASDLPAGYEARCKDAQRFLRAYTDWCNGFGVGYSVALVDGDLDESGEPVGEGVEIDEDSCWGFYQSDMEYVCGEVAAAIKAIHDKHAPDFARGLPLVFAGDFGRDYEGQIRRGLVLATRIAA